MIPQFFFNSQVDHNIFLFLPLSLLASVHVPCSFPLLFPSIITQKIFACLEKKCKSVLDIDLRLCYHKQCQQDGASLPRQTTAHRSKRKQLATLPKSDKACLDRSAARKNSKKYRLTSKFVSDIISASNEKVVRQNSALRSGQWRTNPC